MFFIAGIMIAFTFLIAAGLGNGLLVFGWLLSFGTTLAGIIVGFIELNRTGKALLGVLGNIALLLLFIALFFSSLRSPEIQLPT